jgi:CDP-paratose 2-epimerase
MSAIRAEWSREPEAVRDHDREGRGDVLITGGAGFIGSNLADRLLRDGRRVRVLDNLARAGVQTNLSWLRRRHGSRVETIIADIRDAAAVRKAVAGVSQVYHLAAQVAVTDSLTDPLDDFEVNAKGTLNVLEAIRRCGEKPSLLFTSTNKVYGALADVSLVRSSGRYEPESASIRSRGIDESRPLEFHSPYGCSKGAADQYVLDYSRSFGMPTTVLRMSCVYGPRQFGTEDQGWVAHFLIHALRGDPIVIYGDGMQVRDALFVDDLVEAMIVAQREIENVAGQAFNIGGGPDNTTSLLELVEMIANLTSARPLVTFDDWRLGDQRYYVSDIGRFSAATGWEPRVPITTGMSRLHEWLVTSGVAESFGRTERPASPAPAVRDDTRRVPLTLVAEDSLEASVDQGVA